MNLTHGFYPIGIVISALLFGELLTLGVSWRWVFRLTAIGALVIGIFYNIFQFPKPVKAEHSSWHSIRTILALPGFWLFAVAIFLGAGVESAFTFWSTSYVAAYLEEVPRAGAFAVFIFAALMAIGRFLSAKLSRTMSLKMLMGSSALLGLVVSWALPLANNLIWFYLLLALAGLAAACLWPTILAEAGGCLGVDTTILFVMLSCAGIAGFGFTPWLLGIIGDRTDLKAALSVMPGFFLILLVVLIIEWRMGQTGKLEV
jgi:fucose permease